MDTRRYGANPCPIAWGVSRTGSFIIDFLQRLPRRASFPAESALTKWNSSNARFGTTETRGADRSCSHARIPRFCLALVTRWRSDEAVRDDTSVLRRGLGLPKIDDHKIDRRTYRASAMPLKLVLALHSVALPQSRRQISRATCRAGNRLIGGRISQRNFSFLFSQSSSSRRTSVASCFSSDSPSNFPEAVAF